MGACPNTLTECHDPIRLVALTVPTSQRNQVCLHLVHQGTNPGVCHRHKLTYRDVGQVGAVLPIEVEGDVLRQHVGREGRRRELGSLLPYD